MTSTHPGNVEKRPMRVHAYTNKVQEPRGYIGVEERHYQELQVKRWWGWETIDIESVPDHVRISQGCFGDTGGWVSKFAALGRFGRDGRIT